MKDRVRPFAIPVLLAIVAGAVYLPRLENAPPYLTPDELFSALTAHSVATTGRDLNGRLLPMYFQLSPEFVTRMWYQPIVIYAIAMVLKVLPFTEGTIRVPMAIAAIVDVVLIYYVARLIFRSDVLGIAASILLIVTPAHFINIRVAMDHYAYLPFLLGWLWCVLLYVDRGRPAFLFGAGFLLGAGLYTYIAAYLMMPASALVTVLVLYWRREPLQRYAMVAAGFLIPALVCVPYLLTHPVIRDTLWRYERHESQTAATSAIARGLLNVDRLATAGSTYLTFWRPRFLFVDGPRSRWPIGAFLLPVAGLAAAAIVRAVRRRDLTILLIAAAVATSPILATTVGEPGEIRRAGVMIPAVVLLAIAGLDYLRRSESAIDLRVAAVAVWATMILVAAVFHGELMEGQALVRAASVPLAVTGFAVLLDGRFRDRGSARPLLAALIVVAAIHAIYLAANLATPIGVVLLAAISAATLLPAKGHLDSPDARGEPVEPRAARFAFSSALLAAAATHFLYVYIDYAPLHRVGPVPARAVILAIRLLFSAVATLVAILVMSAKLRAAGDDIGGGRLATVAAAGVALGQLLYFSIDAFSDYRVRFVQCTATLAVVVGVAALLRRYGPTRLTVAQIATAGLAGIAALQFTIFYADYFTGFRVRGSGERDGNERIAFEAVIDRTRDQAVPAVYLGWPGALANLYWRFYAIKHHREDLLARTIPALEFNRDQIRTLPAGSIVVTRPSRNIDAAIDAMAAAGEVAGRELLTAPDGTRAFWILHVGAPARAF